MLKVVVQKGAKRRTVYTLSGWSQVGKYLRLGKHVSVFPGPVNIIIKVWG